MSTVITLPEVEPQVIEYLFTDFDGIEDESVHIRGSKYGCGTPYPETPLSQRRYDGDRPFEDCEPWL